MDKKVKISTNFPEHLINSNTKNAIFSMNNRKKSTSSIFRTLIFALFTEDMLAQNTSQSILKMPVMDACIGEYF